jgi:hypothetical protein
MDSMTYTEYNELRDDIINLSHDLLGTIDYHYLKGKSLIFTLCSLQSELNSGLLNIERQISKYRKESTENKAKNSL